MNSFLYFGVGSSFLKFVKAFLDTLCVPNLSTNTFKNNIQEGQLSYTVDSSKALMTAPYGKTRQKIYVLIV